MEEGKDKVLIASLAPYFLEKGNFWFKENQKEILAARKTQSFFEDNLIFLEKGQSLHLSQFLRKLDEMGYEKVQRISEPGEFSNLGETIEIFPINAGSALKLEMKGNCLEEIKELSLKIADEKEAKEKIKKKLKRQKLYSQLGNLKTGDYLVHLDHGIGQYQDKAIIDGKEYYQLNYANEDKLYVPLDLERKLSRYIGFSQPKISRLGSLVWEKTKRKIKEEAEKLAKELLAIYAQREVATRTPYLPDTEIDRMLADSFPFEETPDQKQVIEEIKRELEESKEPVDRIVCADVGFGKTEVALRILVKAVNAGWQAALICPTTILAFQHYQTFKKRLHNLPVKVDLLSRIQSEKEQKKIIHDLKEGRTDILIGTHRILSDDVAFKNLGLLAIDDEQRFGVKQKEKLKNIRPSLDILSLSATPIPRTLYLALSSLKTISIIQTPPFCRQPIKTKVLPWSKETIKEAIETELERNGQVYYLHNRVETIGAVKNFLQKILPGVKFGVIHGRLNEKEMIRTLGEFQNKKIDVLIATTIIENGLDLPGVNTLIAADATRLGLAQAHQIRGRVGRSHFQAFAYFLHPKKLRGLAKERLKILKEIQELGSGYRLSLKDLEIRGAGNILGKEQSGSLNQVGLNLYCQMLSEAVDNLKK